MKIGGSNVVKDSYTDTSYRQGGDGGGFKTLVSVTSLTWTSHKRPYHTIPKKGRHVEETGLFHEIQDKKLNPLDKTIISSGTFLWSLNRLVFVFIIFR